MSAYGMYKAQHSARVATNNVPKGELTELRLGQRVDVYEVFANARVFKGEIVHIIEAGEKPDAQALEVFFRVSLMATALKQPTIPARVSKYKRLIIKADSGRAFAFPVAPTSHRFYPEGALRS